MRALTGNATSHKTTEKGNDKGDNGKGNEPEHLPGHGNGKGGPGDDQYKNECGRPPHKRCHAHMSAEHIDVAEGISGTTTVTFTVNLKDPSDGTVTVAYTTADGSATAGSDYVPTSGTLHFAEGQTSLPISVQVIGDTVPEPDETFYVLISTPTAASRSRPTGRAAS